MHFILRKNVAPEPAETAFDLNIRYLIFKFLKSVLKAIRGMECQSFIQTHQTVNLSKYMVTNLQINKLHSNCTSSIMYQ